jgi:hypothetical protein
MRILNYLNFIEKNDKLEEKSSGMSFYDSLLEEKTLKYPIEIKGNKVIPGEASFLVGLRNWDVITDYSQKGDTIKFWGGKYKNQASTLSDYPEWDNKFLEDEFNVTVKKSKDSTKYNSAVKIVDSLIKNSQSKGSVSQDATDVTATYSLLISRAIQALSMLRSVMPIGNSEREELVARRKGASERELKRELDVMYKLTDSVNTQVEGFKMGERVADALGMAIQDPTASGNEKMWNEFISIGDQAQSIIKLYLASLLKKEDKGKTESWYDDVLKRSRTEIVKYNEAFASGGNGASESIINALKIYQKGAIKTLSDTKKGTSLVDFKTIQNNLPGVQEQVKKPLVAGVNESISSLPIKYFTLSENEIRILENPTHRIFEKKKRGDISQVQEASYEGAISTLINLSRFLDATVAYFENSEYYDRVKNEAAPFKSRIKRSYDFLTSDSFDNIRSNNPSELEKQINEISDLNDPGKEDSITSWQKKTFAKYENAVVSDQYIQAGDAELAKATDILNKMNTVSALKDKEAQNDLDNIVGRIQRAAEDDPSKKMTSQQKYMTDKKAQEEDLKKSLSAFTGGAGGKTLSDTDIEDISRSVSLLTGKTYKNSEGSTNYSEIASDLDAIRGQAFGNVFRKAKGLDPKNSEEESPKEEQNPPLNQTKSKERSQEQGQGQGGGKLTTTKAKEMKKEASKILEELIEKAEDSPVGFPFNVNGEAKKAKIKEWTSGKKELDSTQDDDLCSPANRKKVEDSLKSAQKNMDKNGQHLSAREKRQCQELIDMLKKFPEYCEL